jgi:hypothetical protein
MLRKGKIKWYLGGACVLVAVAVPSAVAFAATNGQTATTPSLHSPTSPGSGPGTVDGDGAFVPSKGSAAPAAPAGSTSHSWSGTGNGPVTQSDAAS